MWNTGTFELPLGFGQWVPLAQGLTLALLTFVQEDIPVIGSALLAGTGGIGLGTAFLGCFLGIWLGDALLYLLARGFGRPLLNTRFGQRFFRPEAVARSERWFAERGRWLLLASRFVPGTRLPTYLAAGFLKLPFWRFLAVTGVAVGLWTTGIFLLVITTGVHLSNPVGRVSALAWPLFLGLGIFASFQLIPRLLSGDLRRRLSAKWGRLTRWEFWPAWAFYMPVALNYLWLALRHRSLTLPTAANPGIFTGGLVGESKIATLRDLYATSPDLTAEAFLVSGVTSVGRFASVEHLLERHAITYPFILKPDMGQRGSGVKLITNREQAQQYLRQTDAPLLLQRYAAGPNELGVFYYRFPHEPKGRIFAITEKVFPVITGDGVSTVETLIWHDERARFMADRYLQRLGKRASVVLPAGETLKLVEAGNHAQGCIFRDGSHLWSPELEQRIDDISQRLNGFCIGRYDIRYGTREDLVAGRFQIIELNGAASEATSIYDARNSLYAAYRTLFRQWRLVFEIGAANRRQGVTTTKPVVLWQTWRANTAMVSGYPLAD